MSIALNYARDRALNACELDALLAPSTPRRFIVGEYGERSEGEDENGENSLFLEITRLTQARQNEKLAHGRRER